MMSLKIGNGAVDTASQLKFAPGVKMEFDDCLVTFGSPCKRNDIPDVLNINAAQDISINFNISIGGKVGCGHGVV